MQRYSDDDGTSVPEGPETRRLEIHNSSIDEELAVAGACALVHLPTGRVCTKEHSHSGSCEFVTADR
ncbi:hypothetical protein GCM10010435_48670 [Winogradskya consettensis]|uniref:Uncharacterized protein n=2 Tax=Winogradskya TaxID=3240235 RepID=A0A919SHZ4_9ACTN|nr:MULTISPECIES: hypothetical protein [Actinoplanes]GIE25597.1 hypothetical protein Ahu01nite_086990 [Actinoplanes humidus]GIM73095.1 hypothetical protein Aco04nite_33600 [Actinoplanes consettensis]